MSSNSNSAQVFESGGRGEADRQAFLAGGQTETERHMGLSRAAGAKANDVLAALESYTA